MSTAAAETVREPPAAFSGYQKLVVAILAFLQFTIILDFMILSPLGAILMPALSISPQQFGLVVSAYAFSAGAAGFLAAGFADSYDRKKLLLFFYTGFVLGTLFCGLAPTYELLLAARIFTGCFGGVIGSIGFAIITDLFPMSMRGRVMGIVQTAFAASQIMGIPAGLYFANRWGWHAPFMFIVIVSTLASGVVIFYLKPIDGHLRANTAKTPKDAFKHLFDTVSNLRYLQAFLTVALLATGGFMLMPFGSAFSVRNLHIDLEHLPLVYMLTGVCAIISGPLIGRAADKVGKVPMFVAGSMISAVMVLYYTRMGPSSISMLVAVSAIMFVGIQARMISSQALMSGIPAPVHRGSFMAINSCVQQVSGGLASALAGLIVLAPDTGPLQRFDILGDVVVGAIGITVLMMLFIGRIVYDPATAPQTATH